MRSGICGVQRFGASLVTVAALAALSCCSQTVKAKQTPAASSLPEVGVVKVAKKTLQQNLIVSSELVPFQQIDVYAKESGFVQKLNVDYGTHVKAGQIMAVLEIPELQAQLDEDQAQINDATSEVTRARNELERVQAQQKVTHLQFTRLDQVAKDRPGLVAQQEVDDSQGKDLAAQAQVAAANAALESAQSQLTHAQAHERHDQVIFDYSNITAPFTGVVTKRYANLGTLMQSGTNSSTQVLPLVQLSQDDLFRLVIPVPESYVGYIRVGDPVDVRVPSLNRHFPGRVARFSVDVEADTRTMHTEVDVPNRDGVLLPGVYAEATLTLDRKDQAIAVPPEAVNIEGDKRTVWVIDPSGKVQSRAVTLGVETPEYVEVTSGLEPGELVAVGDRSRLSAGQTVRPKEIQLIQYHGG
ncbi:MAG TPA: efflux RND transporter periplasmic adaptor subunit [Bryobacteraceae bacterium]|nr:efflux RND transporter periplasmic adaptor subunit [Bryobacteraceae bacterium]